MARYSWDIDPQKFIQVAENDLTDMVKTISLDAFGMIIRMSPVDTGAFRGNHRLTIDKQSDNYNLTSTGTTNQTQARARIAAINAPFTVVYIQNSLPYAERLENGWSQQAPTGVYANTYNSISQKYGR